VWARVGLRAGGAAACVLAAAGTLAVAVGLVLSFRDASAIARLTATTAGDGFGLLLLCLAFLPNAAAAGVGYVTGAGFTVGGGSFSPLLVHPTELPAIPLLAAAPEQVTVPRMALLAFAGPLLAAAVVAAMVIRRVRTRRDRLIASAMASLVAGGLVAAGTSAARGGVAGGPWTSTGVPVLLAGGLTVGLLAVLSMSWSGLAGMREVPWTAARSADSGEDHAAEPTADADDGPGEPDGDHRVTGERGSSDEDAVISTDRADEDVVTDADSDTDGSVTDGDPDAGTDLDAGFGQPAAGDPVTGEAFPDTDAAPVDADRDDSTGGLSHAG
jgi:hypothetical protein